MNPLWQDYLAIIKRVVKPALGCTEPIAAAYAAAVAAQSLSGTPTKIEVAVSDNLYKNAMGVFVPGTGRMGLAIAAAAGVMGGNAEAGLEVLASITAEQVAQAQALVDQGIVHISRVETEEFIFCKVILFAGEQSSEVTLCGGHTRIVERRINGEVTFIENQQADTKTENICSGIDISLAQIYEFATQIEFEHIEFILQASVLNQKLSAEGMSKPYGLEIGRTMQQNIEAGFIGEDLLNKIVMKTAAAADARMGGATLPAMSNFGSGNQGIAATIPVVVMAELYQANDEKLARALILSHLGAIYIKSHYPPLSAFCGNTVTSAAASMALVYLAGGTFEQSCYAIQNVLSDSTGMICDGAKASCAMKVSTSSSAAVRSFLMAINNRQVSTQGVVSHDVETTIRNVGEMIKKGMSLTDSTIIEIMTVH